MTDIRITTEFCAEDRARVDRLNVALEGIFLLLREGQKASALAPVPSKEVKPADAPAPAPSEVTQPTPTEPAPAADEPASENITPEDIQALVKKLAAPETGKRAACKVIINDYAVNVSSIQADKYPEVMQRLRALEAAEVPESD